MMANRYLSILLLTCFMAIPLHGMIPHDHHQDINTPGHSDTCPEEGHDHGDSDTDPIHCHAFNEVSILVSAKTELEVPDESSYQPVSLVYPSTLLLQNSCYQQYFLFFSGSILPDLTIGYLVTRGPPAMQL